MKTIIANLKMTVDLCNRMATELEKRIKGMPGGRIWTCSKKGVPYYYKKDKDKMVYLKKRDPIIQELFQKEYYQQTFTDIREEVKILRMTIRKLENLYGKTKTRRCHKEFIKEFRMVEVLNKEWREINFEDREHTIYTEKGDYVRSKAEVIIANLLFIRGVPYIYERAIVINGHTVYPDFFIMNVRTGEIIIWEHLGMMGDEKYATKNVRKINEYIKAGFIPGKNLIITMESEGCPLDTEVVKTLIETCCI